MADPQTVEPTPAPPASTDSSPIINRVVAFLGPAIAIVAGSAATWLDHVIGLGLFDLGRDETAKAISQMIVFVLTSGLVWLGQSKWLSGWQRWEGGGRAGG